MYTLVSYVYGNKIESTHKTIHNAVMSSLCDHQMQAASFGCILKGDFIVIDKDQILLEWQLFDDGDDD